VPVPAEQASKRSRDIAICIAPSFHFHLIARLHQDGQSLVLKVGDATRDHLLQADPDTFFVTDHYRGYPYVLAHLHRLGTVDLRKLLQRAIEVSPRS